MLASMSEIDPRADAPLVDWSELGVSGLLPTGTVTLLLADVEGSTRLWETQPEQMTAAFARLDRALSDLVAAYGGVRPVEQGEGDSFVVAFARASDAVACALELQRAPLAPISLRIGVHTGEVQLRDDDNYIGPTINRTARLRNLAHGGQTVLSGTAEALVVDTLPADVWLTDLGSHELRGVARPERVVQLCHPDLRNDFPPLNTAKNVAAHNLPSQFTSFVGRGPQLTEVRKLLTESRLVTLTGAGGVGKTRLAVQVANQLADELCRWGLVRGSGADHRPRSGACHGGACAGTARPAWPLDDGYAAAVCPRPADAGGAGQLRASARRVRRAGRRGLLGGAAAADRCWRPVVSRSA